MMPGGVGGEGTEGTDPLAEHRMQAGTILLAVTTIVATQIRGIHRDKLALMVDSISQTWLASSSLTVPDGEWNLPPG